KLHESVRQKILARPRDLFGPLSETMQDSQGPARENVIAIVQACADARLVYLLAEALMDPRMPVRELAGKSFHDTVRRCCYHEPALVPAIFLALASPLKSAAMAGLAAIESPQLAAAAADQSFRLLDPLLRDAARGITHLKLLPALRKDPPWTLANWHSWLQLI